jgi:hypothetical protein
VSQWPRTIKTSRAFVSNFTAPPTRRTSFLRRLSYFLPCVPSPSFDPRCHLAIFSTFIPFQVAAYTAVNRHLSNVALFLYSASTLCSALSRKCHPFRSCHPLFVCFLLCIISTYSVLFPACSFTVDITHFFIFLSFCVAHTSFCLLHFSHFLWTSIRTLRRISQTCMYPNRKKKKKEPKQSHCDEEKRASS